ncbi:hypothetical protein OKW24_003302 [Peribacillus simplex]|nr:hypothetical protein [Peribacillus simplex]
MKGYFIKVASFLKKIPETVKKFNLFFITNLKASVLLDGFCIYQDSFSSNIYE